MHQSAVIATADHNIHEASCAHLACSLNRLFLLVHSIRASSQLPRLYATQASVGSRFSAYLPTTCK